MGGWFDFGVTLIVTKVAVGATVGFSVISGAEGSLLPHAATIAAVNAAMSRTDSSWRGFESKIGSLRLGGVPSYGEGSS